MAPKEICKHAVPKKLYIAIGESIGPYFYPHCNFNVYTTKKQVDSSLSKNQALIN